jgi:cation:H+ antiporter
LRVSREAWPACSAGVEIARGAGVPAVIFVLAAAVSLAFSAVLATRLERLGARLGLSEAMLGLVAALAADTPEITSAVAAGARGQHDVGIGVVLGSNAFNLAALLGLAAVVAGRIALHRRVVLLEGATAVWVAAVSIAAVAGLVGPVTGMLLLAVVLVPHLVLTAVHPENRDRLPLPGRWRDWLREAVLEEELELVAAISPRKGRAADVVMATVAGAVVVLASVVMERTGSAIGARYAVPGIVVGAVVLAAVTSLPNAVTAVYLARRGRGSATLSVALNSNTLNVVVGLFAPALAIGLGPASGSQVLVAAWYGGLTLYTLALATARWGLGRRSGSLIIALYVVLVVLLVTR